MGKNIQNKDQLETMDAYEFVQSQQMDSLKSLGLVFRHKKTGARVIVLTNDDDNKVFSIGFRTPPTDSTGVPHIIEHSVLCGSKDFPAKDPFVELVKGSLNTFLNAMTYSDKTIYPVASCNDKDFQNLMHVYMDAVFYPNIYKREEIFKQEGWHYELDCEDGLVTYNGVVYNEMKGVFSSPEQQLYRLIQQSLFPDTTYSVESGGDPTVIPSLSYEQFLDFHRKYYHPSNSYIYLYGDMDVEEKLRWMDEQYLSKFEKAPVDSVIHMQQPFGATREIVDYYSIAENESTEDKTYLSYNTVIGTSLDAKLYLAFQVLEHVLISAPGAVLKQTLLDANLGKDVLSSYDNGILQPIFSIIAKNTEEEKKNEFVTTIRQTLETIVKDGIDEDSLRAAINYFEFKYKEADFGMYPKGLMYGIQILDSWLYDDEKPFIHLDANETFTFLKEQINTGYYEQLIQTYLLDNTHTSLVIVKPEVGLTTKLEKKIREELDVYQASLSKEDKLRLIEDTKALKLFQDTPSTKEELEAIPLLSREDIDKKTQPFYNELRSLAGVDVLFHPLYTNGIGYISFAFDVKDIKEEWIPYMGFLSSVLGYVDTENYSFAGLNHQVNIHTGGISSDANVYAVAGKPNQYEVKYEVRAKVLYENLHKAFELIKEILFTSKINDEKRLKEIIAQLRSRLQIKLNSSGHTVAVNRCMSYFSATSYYNDLIGGISYYRFIEKLDDHFEEEKIRLMETLRAILQQMLNKNKLLVSYTADETGYELLVDELDDFVSGLDDKAPTEKEACLKPVCKNEGFKSSSQVQYVARAGNFIEAGLQYTGALKILKVILSYDYLWVNVRVKGGAYGCMSGFSIDGNGYFTSYRDPNLGATNDIYEKTADYVANFDVDERDMTKYIIGTISNLDTPLNPSAKGYRSFSAYLSGVTEEDMQKERDAILSANVSDIRELSKIVKAVTDENYICVIGNENKIEEEKNLFQTTENLM